MAQKSRSVSSFDKNWFLHRCSDSSHVAFGVEPSSRGRGLGIHQVAISPSDEGTDDLEKNRDNIFRAGT